MDKMCSKKLIDRVPCPGDRRVVHIEITGAGLQLLAKIDKEVKSDLLQNLTEKEATLLSDLLDKIR
jgi:DNA-binding MarR family transcriptional regulator